MVYLRREHEEAVGLDDFLALGLVALSYGVALLAHTYAFLAVFAAGLALRFEERRHTGDRAAEEVKAMARQGEEEEVAVDNEAAPAYMASAVLGFAEQLERIGAVALVVLIGGMLTYADLSLNAFLFVGALLFVIRPIAVFVGLLGSASTGLQRELVAWFGIRGIGSIYYLMYAEVHGVYDLFSGQILGVVLLTITASIVLHGFSVTPVMNWYASRASREEEAAHELED